MDVLVASHPSSREHDTGPRHPERPERTEAVLAGIRGSGLEVIELESPPAQRSHLALVHDPSYIEMIQAFCASGGGALDMDTFASPRSWEAALTSAGGVLALIEELDSRTGVTGFAVSRPPGHHALRDRAMGFCLFNNVAVAAAYLRSRGEKVAILDWDVHHGNGTQEMLADDRGTLYVSIHQAHFYPYAGDVEDIEAGEAKGTTINVPLPAGTAGDVYRRAWAEIVLPVLGQFEPDWVLVSAGFDAHVFDQLADLRLQAGDYGWLAGELARAHPVERTILALEGGYDLVALHDSARAVIRGMAGEPAPPTEPLHSPDQATMALIDATDAVARHWRL
jgi:acetoin utilization deacetylase AcuC-like enzyme